MDTNLFPCPNCIGDIGCRVCGGTGLVGLTVALTCPDCGEDKDDPNHTWCASCLAKRYTIVPRGRAFFFRGPKPTIDEINGNNWSKSVTAKAVRRAARQEAYRALGRMTSGRR